MADAGPAEPACSFVCADDDCIYLHTVTELFI